MKFSLLGDWLANRGRESQPRDSLQPAMLSSLAPTSLGGHTLGRYYVPAVGDPESTAMVTVLMKDNIGSYQIQEPKLTDTEADALRLLREWFDYAIPASDSVAMDPSSLLEDYMWTTAREAGIGDIVQTAERQILYYLRRESTGFGILDAMMNDDNLEEISLTRWDRPVRVCHRGFTNLQFMESNVTFASEVELQATIRRLAQLAGSAISRAQPSMEATIHRGSDKRVSATLGAEITLPGSTFSVRKQKQNPITITQLAALESPRRLDSRPIIQSRAEPKYHEDPNHRTLTALMAAYLWLLLELQANIIVAGEPASGKTTMLNALLAMVSPKAKILTVEETPEISLPDSFHWQRFVARFSKGGFSPNAERYEYDLRRLLKLSLRFSPTVVSVGEVRGEESESLANAIAVGYTTVSTVHAEDAERCVTRLTTPPMKLNVDHIRHITAIVTMRRIRLWDGREVRRVWSIDEIQPERQSAAFGVTNVFRYQPAGDSFAPTYPEEVISKSFRLKELAEELMWTNEHLLRSLTNRAAYLVESVREGKFSIQEVCDRVRTYMTNEYPKELAREEIVNG